LTFTLEVLQTKTQQLSWNSLHLFVYGNLRVENKINGVLVEVFENLLNLNENIQLTLDSLKQKTQFITANTLNQETIISHTLKSDNFATTTIFSGVSITTPLINTDTLNTDTSDTTTIYSDTINSNTITSNLNNMSEISAININTETLIATTVESNSTVITTVIRSIKVFFGPNFSENILPFISYI
jgi:hypothetical protein